MPGKQWILSAYTLLVAVAFAGITLERVLSQETLKVGKETSAPGAGQKNENPDKVAFLRIRKNEAEEPASLQVAIARYEFGEGPNNGAYVDLIGAVHIGSKEYYAELNRRFKGYDSMLYELVADPSANKPIQRSKRGGFNPIGGMQTAMKDILKLSFQLDEVDYSPANFVHADMSVAEMGEDMRQRGDDMLGMFARMMGAGLIVQNSKKGSTQQAEMLAAMLTRDPIKLRRVMAEQFESMDSQMAAIADKNGKSTLLTERNTKAFQVMEKELKAGKKRLAIFYGAGHLLDMHQRLIRDYKATQTKVEWLDAWPLK